MVSLAVVKTGGKQYIVRENDLITVDKLDVKEKGEVELVTLATFDEEGKSVELGTPELKSKVKAEVVAQGKGEKIRVARFKAKVRYRKVKGFRPLLTTLKIKKI
jgi:large subunit ribosomal protein L21